MIQQVQNGGKPMSRITLQFIPNNRLESFQWEDNIDNSSNEKFNPQSLETNNDISIDILQNGTFRYSIKIEEGKRIKTITDIFEDAKNCFGEVTEAKLNEYKLILILNDEPSIELYKDLVGEIQRFSCLRFRTKYTDYSELSNGSIKISFKNN